ncbi:MAG: M28 family peptidase [Bacteroidota bacterium]|nr:M28 family peptidase [Bacteroidota bacterium]
MKNAKLFLVFLGLSLILFSCKKKNKINSEILVSEIKEHLEFLASDSLKGRYPGTKEDKIAAEYIKVQFQRYGLKLLADNGFQYFDVVTDVNTGDSNYFIVKENEAVLDSNFIPYSFSKNTTVDAQLTFAGFGFDIKNDSFEWNDFKDIDVNGKWVLIFKGIPLKEKNNYFEKFADDRSKVLNAKDKNAVGVIFVSGVNFDKNDELPELYYDQTQGCAGIPVFHITRALANIIIEESDKSIEEIESEIVENQKPNFFETQISIKARSDVNLSKVTTQNVIAIVESTNPEFKDEYIVVGAHYDHLGMGGKGTNSRKPDTIAVHNGADDNASGTAGVIELAGKIASMKDSIKRSIIFMTFGAEEMGLLGSKYFINNPVVDIKKIKAMLNFDMIGRFDTLNRSLMIGGSGTSIESDSMIKLFADNYDLNLKLSPEGYGPSDHASFYTKDIPVFFISSGAHTDYHTPADDIDKINFKGQKYILDYSSELLLGLINMEKDLTFKEAGPKGHSKHGYKYKITFGIMPDFANTSNNGLGVDAVSPGGAAANGGIKKGDRIIAIDGKEVKNIYDYMNRLKKLEEGQTVIVDVIRDEKKLVLLLQL